MLNEKEKLDALVRLGVDLNQVQDLDILMERILTEARRFVNADAGSIYIRDKERLHFTYTQNETLQRRLNLGEKLIFSTFTIPINDNSIAGHVAVSGQPLNLEDVYFVQRFHIRNFQMQTRLGGTVVFSKAQNHPDFVGCHLVK